MQRTLTALLSSLAIVLTVGCNESSPPAGLSNSLVLADSGSSGTIRGQVVGIDSLPVQGARVLVYRVGPVPPDTVPPDSTPPDTIGTAAPGTFRIDSVPGDSVPPPPPPQGHCGDRGEMVARTRSNQEGRFRVRGLAPGVYDLRAAEAGGRGFVCGVILRSGERLSVIIQLI